MKFLILNSLFFILLANSLKADDTIKCDANIINTGSVEVFSLFATVKNDILGTLPNFCRKSAGAALKVQVDEGEDALTDFVTKLKSAKLEGEDVVKFDKGDEAKASSILFNATKMVVLKKMWNKSSADDQYNLLLSSECGPVGLNRFLFHENKNFIKKEALDSKASYKKTLAACGAGKFEDIAPYITKDVLAETLINLKTMFPQSFDFMTDSFCGELADLDELIFQNDEYADYATAEYSIQSIKDFSIWLKTIYKSLDSEGPKLSKKVQADANSSGQGNYSPEGYFATVQKALEEIYKSKLPKGDADHPVEVEILGQKQLLYKNSKGKYFYKKTEEQAKQEEIAKEMDKQNMEKALIPVVKEMFNQEKIKLGNMYEENLQKAEEGMVPYPKAPGFFIGKDAEGNYYLTLKNKDQLLEKIKKYDEKLSEIQKKTMLNPAVQEALKNQYQFQMMNIDEDTVDIKKLYIREDGKGHYTINDQANENPYGGYGGYGGSLDISSIKEISEYQKTLYKDLTHSQESIPIPNAEFNILSFNGKSYSLSALTDSNPKAIDVELQNITNKMSGYGGMGFMGVSSGKELNLDVTLKATTTYQGRTTDVKKFESLEKDEAAALKDYTGAGFSSLNSCLRSGGCDVNQQNKISNIVNALEKIKQDSWKDPSKNDQYQILFRGTRFVPPQILEQLNNSTKGMILDKAFMSSSGDVSVARNFSSGDKGDGALFILKTKSCVGISIISNFNAEDEFLCPPGLKFNARKKSENERVYILEETN